ncbi:MAG: hypothetical protein JXB45_06500 [Candidatus Krumholzibacteriota bacterium]|nr:hypothetical protein [Candidatus Krumholzibacteriota bacterium]
MLRSPCSIAFLLIMGGVSLCPGAAVWGQGSEDIVLVTSPTAGILSHGSYMFQGAVGPDSGLLFGVKVGFYNRLMTGLSYGVQRFIGRGDIKRNDRLGVQVRFRLLEEGYAGPALALGIDTQGEDSFLEQDERYERKSKGIYSALSKNYYLIRNFSLHGGINYSFEDRDESGPNLFGGFSLEAVTGMSLLLDYNASVDDNDRGLASCRTRGRGYLDAGVRFQYMENLRIRVLFKDLLGNYVPQKGVARALEIFYIDYF